MKSTLILVLFLQLMLEPILVMNHREKDAIKKFRRFNIDFPKVIYANGFGGYCNGLMAHVRGIQESWFCPNVHYVIHAPWNTIRAECKHSYSFCENYNAYCSFTKEAFPLTICTLSSLEPPTSCLYRTFQTNQKLYLLCSRSRDADPIGVIGLY